VGKASRRAPLLAPFFVVLDLQFTGRSVGEISEHVEDFWKRREKKKNLQYPIFVLLQY